MEEITELFLKKGFLLEAKFRTITRNIDSSVSKEFVEAVTSLNEGKLITEKSFFENVYGIKSLLIETARKFPQKRENLVKTINFISSLVQEQDNDEVVIEERREEEIPKTINNQPIQQETQEIPEQKEQIINKGEYSVKNYIIPVKKFTVDDFTEHFKNRFIVLRDIIKNMPELDNLTSISKLGYEKERISIIGMVFSKHKTKNKNIIMDIEDLTGKISVVIMNNRPEVMKKVENIVEDEVIGLKCSGNSKLLFAEDIVFPDIRARRKTFDKDECAAFISDIHIGHKNFLEKEFQNFIKWLNLEGGSEAQKEIAKKVKYLFIVGDNIEGVGVFPGQERLLTIPDLKEQYKQLAAYLDSIRKDIAIFLCPGQHDATRIAEPQPPINQIYAEDMYKIQNLNLVSNPGWVSIGKIDPIKILMYHGASFHNAINEIDELRMSRAHDNPTKAVKILLKKRHLAPSHSFTAYLPSNEDCLLIKDVPDIIATGDLHRAEVSNYNNILLIASSCWQSTTPFEEKVGNHPDPCKVPILNLKSKEVKIIDFSSV